MGIFYFIIFFPAQHTVLQRLIPISVFSFMLYHTSSWDNSCIKNLWEDDQGGNGNAFKHERFHPMFIYNFISKLNFHIIVIFHCLSLGVLKTNMEVFSRIDLVFFGPIISFFLPETFQHVLRGVIGHKEVTFSQKLGSHFYPVQGRK